jgi:hypothetical protein
MCIWTLTISSLRNPQHETKNGEFDLIYQDMDIISLEQESLRRPISASCNAIR